jgi:hypothetical protein
MHFCFMNVILVHSNYTCGHFQRGKNKNTKALRYKPEDRGFNSRWCH